RKPALENLERFEGRQVHYMVKDPEKFRGQRLLIAGGGDSALDWTIFLSELAEKVTLVHRGDSFRGAPDSAEKVFELARSGKVDLLLSHNLVALQGNGVLEVVQLKNKQKEAIAVGVDHFIPLYGLSPKLGPIA